MIFYTRTCALSHSAVSDSVAHQAPLSVGFSRREHWSRLPFPPPGHLPHPGIEPASLVSPVLAGDSLPTEPPGNPLCLKYSMKTLRRHLLCLFPSLFAHRSLPVSPVQSGCFWKLLSPWVSCISVRPKPSGTFPPLPYLICLWHLTLSLLMYSPPSLSSEAAF